MMPAQSLPLRLTLHELLDGFVAIDESGVLANVTPTGLCLDSRVIKSNQVFIALNGEKINGLQFMAQAIDAGAVAVISDSVVDDISQRFAQEKCIPLIYDPLLWQHLGGIAARFYGAPSQAMTVIGITGTDGKTSLSHFVAQALDRPEHSPEQQCGLIGTLGYGVYGELQETGYTTPDAICLQKILSQLSDANIDHVVMEVSSHGLDQGRVNEIEFDVAVLTNFGRDHLDYHNDIETYKQAKRQLFEFSSIKNSVLHWHDDFAQELIRERAGEYPISVFGLADVAELKDSSVTDWVFGQQLQWHADGFTMEVTVPGEVFTVNCQLYGEFNALNVLASIAILRCLGWEQQRIINAVSALRSVNGRMQFSQYRNAATVVIDYAHTPQAMGAVLRSLRQHCKGELVCVFGCGGGRDRGKRPEMGAIVEALADRIIITDDNPRYEAPERIVVDILNGIWNRSGVLVLHDRAEAIHTALTNTNVNDLVLIAGKGHEQYQFVADQKIPFNDQQVVEQVMGHLQ